MSSLSTFQKRGVIKPPEKGSFPLDHDGECKKFMVKYMACLKANQKESGQCREESKAYLNCRMENNLMAKEEWKKLGFKDSPSSQSPDHLLQGQESKQSSEKH